MNKTVKPRQNLTGLQFSAVSTSCAFLWSPSFSCGGRRWWGLGKREQGRLAYHTGPVTRLPSTNFCGRCVGLARRASLALLHVYGARPRTPPGLHSLEFSSGARSRQCRGLFAGRCGYPLLTGSTAFGPAARGASARHPWSNCCASARRLWAPSAFARVRGARPAGVRRDGGPQGDEPLLPARVLG